MPTIKEVATLSGVSLATASMVLRGGVHADKFSKATRERVTNSARKLGYRRNFFASQIRPTARKVLMLFVDTITDAAGAATAERFERRAAERGYKTLITFFQGERTAESDIDREIVGGHGIPAVAVLGRVAENTIAECANDGVSVVLFNRDSRLDKVSTVLSDDYSATIQVAEHIYNQGLEDVWLLCRAFPKSNPIVRVTAFEEYARRASKPQPKLIYAEPMPNARASVKEGYRVFHAALQGCSPPQAVFAINDMPAYGVIRALHEAGHRVGQDVAVVGYGDLWPSSATFPPLTTVHVPHAEMGEVGADLLIDTTEGTIPPGQKAVLTPKLIVRDSGFVRRTNANTDNRVIQRESRDVECTSA